MILKVSSSGISIVMAGLATGLGFAMKDLLENFVYGVSLMAGRLRVGDYIECDGVQGKVESINYQSTQVVTLDGSVIAFQNATLFSKNFKNLTRNHGYVLVKVPVGVAYGVNVERVRKMLVDSLQPIVVKNKAGKYVVDTKQGFSVVFNDFGDSSVDLFVVFWAYRSDGMKPYSIRKSWPRSGRVAVAVIASSSCSFGRPASKPFTMLSAKLIRPGLPTIQSVSLPIRCQTGRSPCSL